MQTHATFSFRYTFRSTISRLRREDLRHQLTTRSWSSGPERGSLVKSLLASAFVMAAAIAPSFAAPPFVVDAIADPHRGQDADADDRRRPADLMEFAQVKPGDTVVDLVPGAGYFTKIFSQIVGPKGSVYAVWPAECAQIDGDEVEALRELVNDPHYSNVTIIVQPAAKFEIPKKAGVVWTSQNYHDYLCKFMGPVDPERLSAAIRASLKPGGVFVVVDHAAIEGSGTTNTEATRRVDPLLVKARALSVGFKFDGESDVLRNPLDPHLFLVVLPPFRGRTDQFVLRFRSAQ
jgi:predicted methyltransferase